MKRIVFFLPLLCIGFCLHAQKAGTYTINADTVLMTSCDSTELTLRNHTDTVKGFLYNTGGGHTIFKHPLTKLSDTSYLVGSDSLKMRYPNAWLQGGNSWGTNGILGTLDKNDLDFYTNHQRQMRLDSNGNVLIGYTTSSGYKLDVFGSSRFWGSSIVTVGNGYDIGIAPGYGFLFPGSSINFGSIYASLSVNAAAYGNIPQGSLIIGQTSPLKWTALVDYAANPMFIVDGGGTATINGGYSGIKTGGSIGAGVNTNSPTFSINGGRGTGSGIPGDIVFSTGTAQDSGTAIHAMTSRWWLKGGTGYLSNTSAPTSSVDIMGAAGYSQLRLRTSYTPTSSSDTNGNVGDFTWDGNYLYIKTTSGWKRSALTTF